MTKLAVANVVTVNENLFNPHPMVALVLVSDTTVRYVPANGVDLQTAKGEAQAAQRDGSIDSDTLTAGWRLDEEAIERDAIEDQAARDDASDTIESIDIEPSDIGEEIEPVTEI